jgi:hypothetical protein
MKFEAQFYTPTGTETPEMTRFLGHYNFVTKFLMQFNASGLRLGTDVRIDSQSVLLRHGQPVVIPHSMGEADTLILQGRIDAHYVSSTDAGAITVIAKLLTTPIVSPQFNSLVSKIQVFDPTLFKVGDRILIGSLVRTISNIYGNEFTLDENVMYDKVYVVSLATETVKAIVF